MNYKRPLLTKARKMAYNFETLGNMAGGAIFGLALQDHNDRRQIEQQSKLQALQIAGQKEMTNYNWQKQLEMWKATNYGAQVEELKKAGLNAGLIYGMKGGGGVTTGSASGNVSGAAAPSGGREIQDLMQMGLQNQMTQAQIKVAEAQAKNIEADTANKPLQGQNIIQDTQLKVLEQVIRDYAGKEAKDTYERIMAPNRSIQAKTYEDELAARQGIAGTIYEMWEEGKLKDISVAQLEAILAGNAKTIAERRNIEKTLEILEENLKGAKLENVMKELEQKLQSQTGIDRNSPAWMKILGRLFVGLLNK